VLIRFIPNAWSEQTHIHDSTADTQENTRIMMAANFERNSQSQDASIKCNPDASLKRMPITAVMFQNEVSTTSSD
jgi:hypothetical protein